MSTSRNPHAGHIKRQLATKSLDNRNELPCFRLSAGPQVLPYEETAVCAKLLWEKVEKIGKVTVILSQGLRTTCKALAPELHKLN